MKLLLTSAGVTNASIRDALVELLGKPIAESTALCIPTAQYGHPMVGPGVKAWQFISGNSPNPMVDLGWKSVGVLELTALPSLDKESWVPLVRQADALLRLVQEQAVPVGRAAADPGWRAGRMVRSVQ